MGPQVLLPQGAGLVLEQVQLCGQIVHLSVRLATVGALCPTCGRSSEAFHSSYRRTIADLPITDRQVTVRLLVRRFRCREKACSRRTFAEQVPLLVDRYARRTRRLRSDFEHIHNAAKLALDRYRAATVQRTDNLVATLHELLLGASSGGVV